MSELITKGGRLSKKHYDACLLVLSYRPGRVFYLVTTGGRGAKRHYKASIYAPALEVIEFFKLTRGLTNDAPRGGRCGDGFYLTPKAHERLKKIVEALAPV